MDWDFNKKFNLMSTVAEKIYSMSFEIKIKKTTTKKQKV